ncbi:hypothetical protein N8I77_011400 [Diaporthe amygdali]|uniref:MYND-type domain-containing protein n=1 Tax=Phomopsis amygdali TaxID=1214568 RepID=A0AAD9S5E8_PHOAM|nr:hypothetical protein N8I77_011400 [Diaporthe amygdali]
MASSLALTIEPRQCQVCHKRSDIQRCGGCKVVYYCSREHQVSDRRSHKGGCTAVKKALADLVREEDQLRNMPGDGFSMPHNVFEEGAGHFWGILGTRNYMRARYGVVDNMLMHFFDTIDAVQTSLDNLIDMLHLNRCDDMGLNTIAPALYLRLGRDQECYDFLKWWSTAENYDWDDMDAPYLDVKGADVFEPPEASWTSQSFWTSQPSDLSHFVCVTLIKVRILLDLQQMQNATRAFQGSMPRELIDKVRGQELVSSVVASRQDIVQASAEETAELVQLVKKQVKTLFDTVSRVSPTFWSLLVDPDSVPSNRPKAYSLGSMEVAFVTLTYNYGSWKETPGSIEVIKGLMEAA